MKFSTLIIAAGLFSITACAQERDSRASAADVLGPGEVATVDGTRIPESVFRLYTLRALQRSPDELTEEERADVIDQLVTFQVIVNAAEARGLPNERAIAAELEFVRIQTLARAMAERFQQENPPTEAELRAVYEENLPSLSSTQYRARHILLETEEAATSVIDELNDGGDFAELAEEHSTGPTGPNGGDLGWFSAESMVAPFAEAVRAMEIGSYSTAPVQTQFGWHVILVEEARDQEPPGLEAVREDITQAAGRQKLDAFVVGLKEAAVIEVSP